MNKANLVKTCGRCHTDANWRFVQYQPHTEPHNRKLNPALYFVRLFIDNAALNTLSFFTRTLLWFFRAEMERRKRASAAEERHD